MSWLSNLFGKKPTEEKKPEPVKKKVKPTSDPLVAPGRKLSPMDAPVIQSRFDAIGIFAELTDSQLTALKKSILTTCQKRKVDQWWAPLRTLTFAPVHELPYQLLPNTFVSYKAFVQQLANIGVLLSGSSWRITGLAESSEKHKTLEDGVYHMDCLGRGDAKVPLEVTVQDGIFDVAGFIHNLNAVLIENKVDHRLLMLPSHAGFLPVISCKTKAADAAAERLWGHL